MSERSISNGGDEVDRDVTQTSIIEEGLDALEEIVHHTLNDGGERERERGVGKGQQ